MRTVLARRSSSLLLAAGLALTPAALAKLPDVVDKAPADALAVLVIPSLTDLDKSYTGMMAAADAPAVGPSALLALIGVGPGMDLSRPMALILSSQGIEGDLPPIIALAPVADYNTMLQAFNAAPADGIVEINMQGEPLFVEPAGEGYAAISPVRALLETFDGAKGGNRDAHAAAIGAMGQAVAEQADAFILINAPALAAMDPAANPFAGALGGPLAQAGLGNAAIGDGLKSALKDSTGGVLALKPTAMGLHLDFAMAYKPGTDRAEALARGGSSSALLKNIPADPFLVAYAFDFSTPNLRALIKDVAGEQMNAMGLGTMFDNTAGQAGAIFPNPAGLFGGLLARQVIFYSTNDPAAFRAGLPKAFEAMNTTTPDGVTTTTTFAQDAEKIDGVSADKYTIKLLSNQGAGGPMGMMYGPAGGPQGHIAAARNGVFMTTVMDPKLMTAALAANADPAKSVGGNATLSQVAQKLPANRTAEIFVGSKPVVEQIMPFLGMMGISLNYTPPADLPPVAAGLVVEGGAFRVAGFVPTPVIKAYRAITQAVESRQPPAGQQQNEPVRPRF